MCKGSRRGAGAHLPSPGAAGPPGRWVGLLVVLVLALATAGSAAAQERTTEGAGPLILHAYTLRYQTASEAVPLIFELLSERGTVEVQPKDNTVVIRDTRSALQGILPVLTAFDHPAREVRLEVQIVQATAGPGGSAPASGLPESLVRRLRELLRYQSFDLVARASLVTLEGEEVVYEIGEEYAVTFRTGVLMDDERIKLQGFRLDRKRSGEESDLLVETNLNLWPAEPMVLGLARRESSDSALMVVLTLEVGSRESPAGLRVR